MILGNLNSVLENESTIMEAVESNIITQQLLNNQQVKKQSRISRILSALSNYGMNYTDQVMKNMRAIPADKALQPKPHPKRPLPMRLSYKSTNRPAPK